MNTDGPAWPLIVVHSGDDELSYIDDLSAWLDDASLSAHPHQPDDFAIDSQGLIFRLRFDAAAGRVEFENGTETIARDRFSSLVKNHLSALKQCCVSKIHDYTFELGFDLVKKALDA